MTETGRSRMPSEGDAVSVVSHGIRCNCGWWASGRLIEVEEAARKHHAECRRTYQVQSTYIDPRDPGQPRHVGDWAEFIDDCTADCAVALYDLEAEPLPDVHTRGEFVLGLGWSCTDCDTFGCPVVNAEERP